MIRDFFYTIYTQLCMIIAPPFCAGCLLFLEKETIFCEPCLSKITPVAPLKLSITHTKIIMVYALGAYEFPLKKLILAKNHRSIAASRLLGQALWDHTFIRHLDFDYVVPIPLHWTRKQWRGFNQAEEMSMAIAQHAHKPLINILTRCKKTKFQAECGKEDRAHNILDAFSFVGDASLVRGKTILLVDDLKTTGGTLIQASKVLYKAGAQTVIAVVGARVL